MTFETPSLPFRISLYLNGRGEGGGGELQTLHGMAHFVSTEKPSMAPTHKHPVKKKGASFETYSNSNNELDF